MSCERCTTGFCVRERYVTDGVSWGTVRCVNCGWVAKGRTREPAPGARTLPVPLWPLEPRQWRARSVHK